MEIWMMPELRHLCVSPAYMPAQCRENVENNSSLTNLQRLSKIRNFKCDKLILRRMPNLKQLEIWYDGVASSTSSEYQLEALVHLQQLEILKLYMMVPRCAPEFVTLKLSFPHKLKRLSLSGSRIPWDDMMIAGALENLEVLKLRRSACRGTEWRPIEGQFCKLKYLLLEELELAIWVTHENHFPLLEHLVIRSCHNLDEIPCGIGDIPTLQTIKLVDCNARAVISAEQLRLEQVSVGNEDLRVHTGSRRRSGNKFYSRILH